MTSKEENKIKEYLGVFLIFTLLAAVLTYPAIFHLSTDLGGGDDAFNCWVLAWGTHAIMTDPLSVFHANIFYPAGNSFAMSEHMLGWIPFTVPLSLLGADPVFIYNFLEFLTFVLCGCGAYLLTYRYTKNRYASVVSGILFAFCTIRFGIQFHLLTVQWIPFMLLFLDRYLHEQKTRDLALATFFFIWSTYMSWHTAVFASIIGVLYLVGHIILDKNVRKIFTVPRHIAVLLLALGIVILCILPIALPYLDANERYNANRTIDVPLESAWSLDPIRFITYLGPIGLILAFIGLCVPISTKKKEKPWIEKQKCPLIFACIGIVGFILMLGPILKIAGSTTDILLPYFYAYKLFPMIGLIRSVDRYVILIHFAVAMLAGYGTTAVLARIPLADNNKNKETYRIIVGCALILCAIAGSWHVPVPISHEMPAGADLPGEYQFLLNLSTNDPIIEIPTRWLEDNPLYLYYSMYHWHPLVNGYSGRDIEEASRIMRLMGEFPSNNSVSVLQEVGVRYLFFHADRFADYAYIPSNQRDAYMQQLGEQKDISALEYDAIKNIGVFGSTHIYEILPEPRVWPNNVILTQQDGWHGYVEFGTANMKDRGRINAYAPKDGEYNLMLKLRSSSGRKDIMISVNGEDVDSISIPKLSYGSKSVVVPIVLHQGNNEILFESDGCTPLWDIPELQTFSDMCISFTFLDIIIEEA